jgi:hypothetical protein
LKANGDTRNFNVLVIKTGGLWNGNIERLWGAAKNSDVTTTTFLKRDLNLMMRHENFKS